MAGETDDEEIEHAGRDPDYENPYRWLKKKEDLSFCLCGLLAIGRRLAWSGILLRQYWRSHCCQKGTSSLDGDKEMVGRPSMG